MGKKQAPSSEVTSSPWKKSRTSSSNSGNNVPSISEMHSAYFINVPTYASKKRNDAGDEKVHIYILEYCSKGSVYGENFNNHAMQLVLLHCMPQEENPLYNIRKAIGLNCVNQHKSGDEKYPSTYDQFEKSFEASFVFFGKNSKDPDDVGYVQGAGFYTTAGVALMKDFLMTLDDTWKFRLGHTDDDFNSLPALPDVVVHVAESFGLKICKDADETFCTFEVLPLTEAALKNVSVLDLPPPTFPGRNVMLTVEPTSSGEEVHLIFGGNTKPFMDGFNNLDIKLQYVMKENSEYREYYRTIEHVDIVELEEAMKKISTVLGDACLCHSPVILRVKEGAGTHKHLSNFISELCKFANIHFRE